MDKLPPTADKRCGTYSGYKAHRDRTEQLCQPCRDAMNAYRREKWHTDPKYKNYHKRYRKIHSDKIKEQQKKYRKKYTPEEIAAKEAAIAIKAANRAAIEERKAKRAEQALFKKKAKEERIKARLERIEANKAKKAKRAKEHKDNLDKWALKRLNKELAIKQRIEERTRKRDERRQKIEENSLQRKEEQTRLANQHGIKISDYDRCRKNNKTACDPCKAVAAKYVREKFNSDPKYKEAEKRWRKANPHKSNTNSRDRARKKGLKTEYYTRQHIFDRDGYNCYICNTPVDLTVPHVQGQPGWEMYPHIEHVIPLAKGGDDTLENVKIAHAICNINKGTKLLSESITL